MYEFFVISKISNKSFKYHSPQLQLLIMIHLNSQKKHVMSRVKTVKNRSETVDETFLEY